MVETPDEQTDRRARVRRVIGGVAVLLGLAAAAAVANRDRHSGPAAAPVVRLTYLDLQSSQVIVVNQSDVGPALEARAVPVFLYSCGECDQGPVFGYAQKLTEEAQVAAIEAEKNPGPSAATAKVDQGTLVAAFTTGQTEDQLQWYPQHSDEGADVLQSVRGRCANGAKTCVP